MFFALPLLFLVNRAEEVLLHSSCEDLDDGYHWMQLISNDNDNTYPPVNALCDNGYMIIDVKSDPHFEQYFSSLSSYHTAIYGPDQMDGANWEQWWKPNAVFSSDTDNYFRYAISSDCSSCNEETNTNSLQQYASQENADAYGDRTAYYMTGTIFGCLHTHKAKRDCLWDPETYECGMCTSLQSDSDLGYRYTPESDTVQLNTLQHGYQRVASQVPSMAWTALQVGLCGVYPQSTYNDGVPQTRDECNTFRANIKPSIGNDGRYCVCVQPPFSETFEMEESELLPYKLTLKEKGEIDNAEAIPESIDDIYELYQHDFLEGTYRITKSGTYVIMEDIVFDFNAGDLNEPNSDNAWWPGLAQKGYYEGTFSTRDAYFMGFFAGITVETDSVIIDLNGFTIGQSKAFYYQQRHFSCISLKSVVFNLNQGPGIFGTDPRFASDVTVKNGQIGLSSHFGIHGQNNVNVLIKDIHIYDFETHGIEMSYFENLQIQNVEIGPSSSIAYLKGEYAYARFTLQKLQRMHAVSKGQAFEGIDSIVKQEDIDLDAFPEFANKDESTYNTLPDLVDTLKRQMDIAFKHVMNIEEFDENDADFKASKQLFINDDGIPYGAVMYGLFLNLYFANVFIIHPSLHHSKQATIENLKIHDLKHKTIEYIRLEKYSVSPYKNPYNSALDAKAVLGDQILDGKDGIDWSKVTYVGDVLIDAHIALNSVSSHWGEKGFTMIDDDFTNWVQGKLQWTNDADHTTDNEFKGMDDFSQNFGNHPWLGCNGDRMMHLNKGVMGIRMDGAEDIEFVNLEISDIYEQSELGSELCGDYWDEQDRSFKGGNHFLQNSPYAVGFTGNMAHGIFSDFSTFTFSDEIKINNIESNTGLVRGIGMYTSSSLHIEDGASIMMHNLNAGVGLYSSDTANLAHPYAPSIAKPFHIVSEYTPYTETLYSEITYDGNDDDGYLDVKCVFGRDGIANDQDELDEDTVNSGCSNRYDSDIATTRIASFLLIALIVSLLLSLLVMFIYWRPGKHKNVDFAEYTQLQQQRPSIITYGTNNF